MASATETAYDRKAIAVVFCGDAGHPGSLHPCFTSFMGVTKRTETETT